MEAGPMIYLVLIFAYIGWCLVWGFLLAWVDRVS